MRNTSSKLDYNTVYSELRHEMTSIFSAIKNLLMGEFTLLLILLTYSFQQADAKLIMLSGLLLIAIPFVVSIFGVNWFVSAIRVGNYLFLNFDLWELFDDKKSDKRHLWLLANRSESNATKIKHYHMTEGINLFLKMQRIILLIILWLLFIHLFAIAVEKYEYFIDIISYILVFIMALVSYLSCKFIKKSIDTDITGSSMDAWLKYMAERETFDNCYLVSRGIELSKYFKDMDVG